jgi:hypothetical protein
MTNFIAALWLAPSLAFFQGPSEGSNLLFKNVTTKISDVDKQSIFKQTGLKVSKDKTQFISSMDENGEFPFAASVYPTDLNKDGNEEIFVVYGNSFTSGSTGSDVMFFVKDASGKYKQNFAITSAVPMAISTSNKGYPDLVLGGPGFEFPVWRWDGSKYDNHKVIKDSDLEKLKAKGVDELSAAYTGKKN